MNENILERVAFKTTPIGQGNESIITPIDSTDITEIDRYKIKQWLARHGVFVLRGFDVDKTSFSKLIHQSSSRVTVDPARTFVAKNTQLVNAGTGAVGLHCENGNAPRLPDLLWFHCIKAAKEGSQTTLEDPSNTVSLHRNQAIGFSRGQLPLLAILVFNLLRTAFVLRRHCFA